MFILGECYTSIYLFYPSFRIVFTTYSSYYSLVCRLEHLYLVLGFMLDWCWLCKCKNLSISVPHWRLSHRHCHILSMGIFAWRSFIFTPSSGIRMTFTVSEIHSDSVCCLLLMPYCLSIHSIRVNRQSDITLIDNCCGCYFIININIFSQPASPILFIIL